MVLCVITCLLYKHVTHIVMIAHLCMYTLTCTSQTSNVLYIVGQNFYKFWPDDETEYGKVKVSLKSKNERNSYNGYKFSIVGEAVVSGT